MQCVSPFFAGSLPCACQRCLPCLINRRRVWTHRILLEAMKHGESSFVTLTYDAEHVPGDGGLFAEDLQGFFKRLRRAVAPSKIRYFAAGEYGKESLRPHYHAAVFGLDVFSAGGFSGVEGVVRDSWHMGHTFVGNLNRYSAQYVAGYVTKKGVMHDERLPGEFPEFCRMSLRPGLGASFIADGFKGLGFGIEYGRDAYGVVVPNSLRHGGALWPLGRYLRGKLRRLGGVSEDQAKASDIARAIGAVQRVRKEFEGIAGSSSETRSYSEIRLDNLKQILRNVECRYRISERSRL